MKDFLPYHAKPSKVLSKEQLRTQLTCAHVVQNGKGKVLVASDSFTLARLPVGDEIPLGPISGEAMKLIEKGADVEFVDGAVKVSSKIGSATYEPPQIDGKVYVEKAPEFAPQKGERVAQIAFNPTLLKNLSDALGCGSYITLEVRLTEDNRALAAPMKVTAKGREGEGLLMPVRMT